MTEYREHMVPVDGDKHPGMFQTLVLLGLHTDKGHLRIVVESCCRLSAVEEMKEHSRFFYEEHTCPVNFLQVPAVWLDKDSDHHGIFDFIDAAWMTPSYIEARDTGAGNEFLQTVFPQLANLT